MAIHYYYQSCEHAECKEKSCREFSSRRDYNESIKRNRKWRCVKHSQPEEYLSKNNLNTKVELIVIQKESGKYWQYVEDAGTDKVRGGFIFGTGYKASADEFDIGTKLTVTANIELPE